MGINDIEIDITQKNYKKDISKELWLKTFSILLTFGVMGLCSALVGTTYVHLELLFGVTSQKVSYTIVILSTGYLIGAVVCGVVYDRLLIPEAGFMTANILASVATLVAGYMTRLELFIAALTIQGVAFGYNDAAGQTYCINSWEGKKYQKSILQASHAFWSAGGILGPVLVKIFLVEISDNLKNDFNNSSDLEFNNNSKSNFNFFFNSSKIDHYKTNKQTDVEKCRYAYVLFGVVIMFAVIPFIYIFFNTLFKNKKSTNNKKIKNLNEKNKQKEIKVNHLFVSEETDPKTLSSRNFFLPFHYIIFLILISFFCIFTLYMETLPISYLVFFALKHLKWSVLNSTRLLSCFFAFHLVGRLVAIATSIWVRPRNMLAFNLSICCVAYIIMTFVDKCQYVVWLSVVLAGFGVSTTFPTSLLWVTEYVNMDGKLGSMLIVSSSIGMITGPYIMSFVTSEYNSLAYVYMLLAASVTHALLFTLQLVFIKFSAKIKTTF